MKLLTGAFLVLMAFVLVACPAGQTVNPRPEETEAVESEEPEATEEPEETDKPEETNEPEETEEAEETDQPVAGGGCPDDLIESEDSDASQHVAEGETVEYDTNPPAAGPHAGSTADVGVIYDSLAGSGYTLENFVHNMEHGAVIFWTNDLPEDEFELAQETVDEIFSQGYEHLIMVEYNDMDVPFAMTAWGVLQECEGMDEETAEIMQLFTDTFYGSGIEGSIACSGAAAELEGCEKWAE